MEGRQEEEHRQDVLALGNPCHRFYLHGVQQENEGPDESPSLPAADSKQEEINQDAVQIMQENVCEQIPRGLQPPERVVKHVREDVQRGIIAEIRPS